MVYGKGGVALVGDRYHSDDVDGNFFFDATENRIGWTAGAGVEWAFTPEWSVKLEYNYYGFGTKSVIVSIRHHDFRRGQCSGEYQSEYSSCTARREFPRPIWTRLVRRNELPAAASDSADGLLDRRPALH